MPHFKLTYFGVRGLVESARLCLHYAGQKFEDVRLTFEEFGQLKSTLPNGQVPLLEVDGHKISQSGAIVRYLANRFHLNGKDEFEAARADSIYGYFYDQIRAVVSYNQILLGMREGDKQQAHEEVFLPVANKSLDHYSKLLHETNSGFMLKSGISYADFVVAEHLNSIFQCDPSLKSKHPDLVNYMERIHSTPQIAEYVKSRPVTPV